MTVVEMTPKRRSFYRLRHAARRLGSVKFWQLHRIIGRFDTGRAISRWWRRGMHRLMPPPWALATTVFETVLIGEVVDNLRRQGYFAGLQLPDCALNEIYEHARKTPCRRHMEDEECFLIDAISNGHSPQGRPVAVADVDAQVPCNAITRLAGDAKLVEMVTCHLGYGPRKVVSRLYWSPVSGLSNDSRRWNGQTIDYHYDMERGEALYVYFYLTNVTETDGCHVLVAGSHLSKPLGIKLSSTQQPECRVLKTYGAENIVIVEGRAGFGFLENPACFHKVLPPRQSNRLMLQFRYT